MSGAALLVRPPRCGWGASGARTHDPGIVRAPINATGLNLSAHRFVLYPPQAHLATLVDATWIHESIHDGDGIEPSRV
jgi:hypothetical protein